MKTQHAQELRKGIREARKLIIWEDWPGVDEDFKKVLYNSAIKRSTFVSYQAFKRTLERAGMVN